MKKFLLLFLFLPFFSFNQKNIVNESSVELLRKGIQMHDDKEYFDAIQKFKKVSVNDTNYFLAQYEAALSYIALEEYNLSQRILKNLITSELPFDFRATVYKMLAQTYEGEKKFDEAIKTYDAGLKMYPKNFSLYFSKGITLEKMEKYQEALQSYKNALKCNMNHASSHLRLGVLAAHEGHYTESYLSLMTFLLLEPTSDRSSGVVALLEELADGSYNSEPKNIQLSAEGDDFENVNLFFKNQVALQDKYKVKLSYPANFGKQLHLILSNTKYNEEDKGYWTQTYLPFYLDIFNENLLDAMVLFSLQSVNNDKVQKKVNSKKAVVNGFIDKISGKWSAFISKQFMDYEGTEQEVYAIYNSKGLIYGKMNDQKQASGNWYYYHPEGNLNLVAKFIDGKKEGLSVWRDYFTQNIIEESEYVNGELNGLSKFYYSTGELQETKTYKKDVISDTLTSYYRNGQIEEKIAVSNGKRNGLNTGYFENGNLSYKINYVDNVGEGKYENFYGNGQLKTTFVLVKDNIIGERKSFHQNGQVESISNYTEKGTQGEFTNWYANGQIESKGMMKDGNYLGEILNYYSNGLLKSKGVYDDSGKENGKLELFDSNGKKYQEYTYKKGSLEQIKHFDASEKLIKTIDKSGKKIIFEVLSPSTRVVKTLGTYVDDKRSGTWKYFDDYGNLETEESYKNGLIEDTVFTYFTNGQIKYKYSYENNEKNGLYLEYNSLGELTSEGKYKDDELSNDWYEYYDNGNLKEEYSYKNGKLHGYQKNYGVNGKMTDYTIYENGKTITSIYLDTALNEMQRFGEFDGLISLKNPINTFTNFIGEYKNGYVDGKIEWFDFDKVLSVSGNSRNGKREGNWKWFHENGKLEKSTEYKNGMLNGKSLAYFENGVLASDLNYFNNLAQGEFKFFHENGKIDYLVNYLDDYKHGKAISYSPSGEIQMIKYFDNDVLVAYSYLDKTGKEVEPIKIQIDSFLLVTYFQNGLKSFEQTRINGELHGKYYSYFPNGKLQENETYVYGNRVGEQIEFYDNGNKKRTSNYKWDLKHGLETNYFLNGKVKSTENFLFDKRHGEKKEYNAEGKLIKVILFYNDEVVTVTKY